MMNDEARRNDESPNEMLITLLFRHSSFVLRHFLRLSFLSSLFALIRAWRAGALAEPGDSRTTENSC